MTQRQIKLVENYIRRKVKSILSESNKAKFGSNVRITDKNSMKKGKVGVITGEMGNNWLVTIPSNPTDQTVVVSKNGVELVNSVD